MTREPPGTLRVVSLLARNSLRRWTHRWAAARHRKKKGTGRGPTARKKTRSTGAMVFFGVWMLVSGFLVAGQFVGRVDHALAGDAPEAVIEIAGEGAARPDGFHAAVGILLAVVAVSTLCSGIGSTELGSVGWSLEWLYTFPVSTRGLFLARIGEYALTNAFGWFVFLPLLAVTYWTSGYGAWGLLLGVLCAFYLNLLVASVRVVVETWLRKRLGLRQLKNVQALCTVLSILFFFGAFWLALSRTISPWYLDLARATPEVALWFPFSLPALVTDHGAAALGLVAFAALFAVAATAACGRLVRDGLVTSTGGPYAGTRAPAAPAKPSRLRGMLGKETWLLARDRNFMVQTLLVPLFIVGIQAVVNPQMFASGGRGGAVLAFGIGAYVLMFGGFSVLAVERKSLWLLFTLPHPLARLLRQKVILWGTVATVYTVGVLLLAWRPDETSRLATLLTPVFVIGGIFLFAAIASGLGAIAADPLAEHAQQRIQREWMWLYMLAASIYGAGIYGEALYHKCILVVLFLLLAYAIWQKVEARLPLLLDPNAQPPPRLTLSEGIIATLLFFQIQQVFFTALVHAGDLPLGARIVVAYVVAGFFAVLIILWILRRARIPLDLRSGVPLARAAGVGCGYGAVGAVFAFGYLLALERIEPLRQMREEAWNLTVAQDPSSRWWFAGLVVIAAPVFEEFIFRGLLYRGLRKTAKLKTAVVGSALIFGVVHPPLSFLPVFLLGVLAALGYERTRSLWTPIAAHMTYNAAVVVFASNLIR